MQIGCQRPRDHTSATAFFWHRRLGPTAFLHLHFLSFLVMCNYLRAALPILPILRKRRPPCTRAAARSPDARCIAAKSCGGLAPGDTADRGGDIALSGTSASSCARSESLEFADVRACDLRNRRSEPVGNQRFVQCRWVFMSRRPTAQRRLTVPTDRYQKSGNAHQWPWKTPKNVNVSRKRHREAEKRRVGADRHPAKCGLHILIVGE